MPARRRAAFGLWTALTFASAVVIHGVVHAAGSGAFVWDSPAHVVMLAVALALLVAVAVQLGFGRPASERRRRLALVRASLGPATPVAAGVGALTQIAVAASLFFPEGASLEPERLAIAVACGLVALLCSALVFRATGERVVALLVAFSAAVDAPAPLSARVRRAPALARATKPYGLFVPNRPPPSFAL